MMESTSTNPRNDARNEENLDSNDKTLVLKKYQENVSPRKTLIINIRRSSRNELFIRTIHGLCNSIPKHITTLDEKYVLRCLESIHNCALRAASWNFTSNMADLAVIECSSNMAKLATDLTVSGSQTMVNILNSQLLQKFGSFDCDVNTFDNKYLPEPMHERDSSISSTNSSFSDQSSSSSAYGPPFSQGTLHFTWRNGLPIHVFTVDGKNEVYVAKLSKVEFSDSEKSSDYVYTFYSSNNGKKKECDVQELEMESIAKMLVSTSVKHSDNSETRETRFALFASSELTSNHVVRKNKRLKTKVVDIFKSIHPHKQRSNSKLLEDTRSDNDFLDLSPNLELAAIIVKEVRENQSKARLGGWGLNFLKRPSTESSICSECSTNVIIPAGFHGGPRNGGGGPSGLTERWISGGCCDCGGWDTGCPLTILKSLMDNPEEFSSLDLFAQGLKTNAPIMKLVSFREDMYYIHFQSTLSSLQSFAIAAAIIHSRSSLLRSKVYKS